MQQGRLRQSRIRRVCQEILNRAECAKPSPADRATARTGAFHGRHKQADIVKIIAEIVSTVTNIHLYPPTHPQVAPLVDQLYESISRALESAPELTIIIVDDDIVLHGKPLTDAGPVGKSFVKLLKKKEMNILRCWKVFPGAAV